MTDNTKTEQFRQQRSFIKLESGGDKFESTVVVANDVGDRATPYASISLSGGALSFHTRISPESMRTLRDELSKAIRRYDRWEKGEAKRIAAEQRADYDRVDRFEAGDSY